MAVKQKVEKLSKTKSNKEIIIKENEKTTNEKTKKHIVYHTFKRLIDIAMRVVLHLTKQKLKDNLKLLNLISRDLFFIFIG